MSKATPTHQWKTEDDVTTHSVTLTNGEILLIQEDPRHRELGIAIGDSKCEFEADMWVCNISANGVQVLPNSGYGPEALSSF